MQGKRGGRCCRSGPPDKHGSPYKSASAFAAWPGLLAEPSAPVTASERIAFRERAADWIEDWIAFAGVEALDDQVRFDREWAALRRYAGERGVKLIGDAPIYVADGSADVLAHPRSSVTTRWPASRPTRSPPTASCGATRCMTGRRCSGRGYAWWIKRFRRIFELFDLVRIDHFRGVHGLLGGARGRGDGRRGQVGARAGPGAVRARAARARRAAADRRGPRGDHAAGEAAARCRSGCRGWRCCSSASRRRSATRSTFLELHEELQVVYTGTHDNDTIRAWYDALEPESFRLVATALESRGIKDDPHWAMIRLAFSSPAAIAMIQLQDALGLGPEGRMNQPGTAGGWGWQLSELPSARWPSGCARPRRRPAGCRREAVGDHLGTVVRARCDRGDADRPLGAGVCDRDAGGGRRGRARAGAVEPLLRAVAQGRGLLGQRRGLERAVRLRRSRVQARTQGHGLPVAAGEGAGGVPEHAAERFAAGAAVAAGVDRPPGR